MATTTTTAALSMKLLIDTKSQRVLFAEASKEVADFLFTLLAVPVGSAAKLLGEEDMVGSVGNLYASVGKLDGTYVLSGAAKDSLLLHICSGCSLFRLGALAPAPAPAPRLAPPRPNKFFRCDRRDNEYHNYGYICNSNSCRDYMTDDCGKACPSCGHQMAREVQFLPSAAGTQHQQQQPVEKDAAEAPGGGAGGGFVQGVVTYTVTDDLTVTPMSAISSITLLNDFAVTDLAALQERTVQIGYNEGLGILKASLQSKTVLTDVFLGNKAAATGDA
ncbi:unnamed protein product [Urochloa decumbens]|uniref:Uncharacterized protein n=1 Tax=Urochloa decumbens TaxID=240449 RepID=A0ABC8ZUT6_9POAL